MYGAGLQLKCSRDEVEVVDPCGFSVVNHCRLLYVYVAMVYVLIIIRGIINHLIGYVMHRHWKTIYFTS